MTRPEWDDERVHEAFAAAFDRTAPAGLVERTLAAAREPAVVAPRHWWSASQRWRVAGLVTTMAVAGAVFAVAALPNPSGGPAPTSGPGTSVDDAGFTTYDDGFRHFLYPSAWQIHTLLPATSGFGSTIAVLGTVAVDPSCGGGDLNCLYLQQMQPGTVRVVVGQVSTAPSTIFDIPLQGTDRLTTVGGEPAVEVGPGSDGGLSNGADITFGWEIATPMSPTEVTTIFASIKGPNTDRMHAQVEALIASFGFAGAPLGSIPPGPAGFALAGPAAATAMTWLDLSLRANVSVPAGEPTIYGCIPVEAWQAAKPGSDGVVSLVGHATITIGSSAWLGGPVDVRCEASIQALGTSYWRLNLAVTPTANSSDPGSTYTQADLLAPDGTVVETTEGGALAPSKIELGPGQSLAMARAAHYAMAALAERSDFYACFKSAVGVESTGVITHDPDGVTHYTSVTANCSAQIGPRSDGLAWTMNFLARWPAADGHKSGEMVANVDVDAAGVPEGAVVSGDPLPYGPPIVSTPSPQSSPASP